MNQNLSALQTLLCVDWENINDTRNEQLGVDAPLKNQELLNIQIKEGEL